MKILRNLIAFAALLFCISAFAQNNGSIPLLQKGLADALDQVFTLLQGLALKWLGIFMILQFVWTNWQLIISDSDITKVFAKLASSIFWFGICVYIFNNGSEFIKNVSSDIMQTATGATGVVFDPIQPINTGITVASQLLETLDSTQSILASFNPFPAIMMGIVAIVILAVAALLAFKILMVFIETKMVIALSPLSFALLGLNAFRDQGLAPLKYLVSMAIRMFLYGAVLAAMQIFSTAILGAFKALPAASDPSVWPPIWAAAMGYVLLGAVAMRVDSIAVMLASGSSQMSTGDAAAVGAVAASAAVGAMAGGAAVAAVASKPMQTMSDFLKGGGAAVSNAGGGGSGGGAGTGLLSPPSASRGGGGGGGGGVANAGDSNTSKPDSKQVVTPQGRNALNVENAAANAGASPSVINAVSNAAYAGGSNEDITAAAMNAGATPEIAAAAAGANSDISGGKAITQNRSDPSPTRSTSPGSGAGAGIGKPGGENEKASGAPQRAAPTQKKDHLANLNHHLNENAGAVHVQMNTHIGD